MDTNLLNLILILLFGASVAALYYIALGYISLGIKNKELQKRLDEVYEDLRNSDKEATKERLRNVELKAKHEALTKKYDFMRTNARKFNVGDIVKGLEIVKIDVKVPSIIDHVITGGIMLFNSLFDKKSVVEFKKIEFIYKVKQSEPWFTESELENHSNSTTITKRKYKKRTIKK